MGKPIKERHLSLKAIMVESPARGRPIYPLIPTRCLLCSATGLKFLSKIKLSLAITSVELCFPGTVPPLTSLRKDPSSSEAKSRRMYRGTNRDLFYSFHDQWKKEEVGHNHEAGLDVEMDSGRQPPRLPSLSTAPCCLRETLSHGEQGCVFSKFLTIVLTLYLW